MRKLLYKITLCCVLILLSYLLPSISTAIHRHNSSNPNGELAEKLDAIVLQNLARIPVPNLSIAVQTPSENFSLHYGESQKSFALGSTSKSITASTLIHLLNLKNISLDEKVSDFLPSLTDKRIRIIDLLNHTSGISTYDNDSYRGKYGSFEYANENYNLIGDLIAALSGKSYEETVQEVIFSPLQMNSSFAINKENSEEVIDGYQAYFGLLLPQKTTVPTDKSWITAPSGLIASTSSDGMKYLQWVSQNNFSEENLLSFVKKQGISVKKNPAVEGVFGDEGIYCSGWIQKKIGKVDMLYHTGKLSNFNSIFVIIPNLNIKIVVLSNVGDFPVATSLLEQLYERIILTTVSSQLKISERPTDAEFEKNINYIYPHFVINIVFLLWISFCISTNKVLKKSNSKPLYKIGAVGIYGLIPILLISIFPLMRIPYVAVRDFFPDLFWGITIGYLLLILSVLFYKKSPKKPSA
ncbi:MAG: serine hydrolase domain-containing protein [Peptostreptococcaceae bacterium]|nr:serine hydrolase domain-containing protein [Peptostreptococcaceae bacterium]